MNSDVDKSHFESIIVVDGVEIWDADYSSCSESQYLEIIERQLAYTLKRSSEVSFFVLNVKKSPCSIKIVEASKKARLKTQGITTVTGLYGLTTLGKLILKIISITQNHKIAAFDNREAALQYVLRTAKAQSKT